MKKALSLFVLTVLMLSVLSACGGQYTLAGDNMKKYYSITRADYTGKTVTVPKRYEITDEMVEDQVESLRLAEALQRAPRPIALGDNVGIYVRGEYDGAPLPDYTTTNYGSKTPLYADIVEGSTLNATIRAALLGKNPADYALKRRFSGTVKADDTIIVHYEAYTEKDGVKTRLRYMENCYADLTMTTEPAILHTVGMEVGVVDRFTGTETVGGVETTVYYYCMPVCVVTEEKSVKVEVPIAADAYATDSPYAYLNGKTVTFYVVPYAIYLQMQMTDEDLENYFGFTVPEGSAVEAFYAYVRAMLEKDVAENYLYDLIYDYFFRTIVPDSYPKELDVENRVAEIVHNLLTDEEIRDLSVRRGYESLIDFLRDEYDIHGERYDGLSDEEVLTAYFTFRYREQMLIAYLVQVEKLAPTEKEYEAYLDVCYNYLKANGVSVSRDKVEAYYAQSYSETYLRDELTKLKIKDFLFWNNTVNYAD